MTRRKYGIIIEVTNDEYEFIVDMWDTYEECAEAKHITIDGVKHLIHRHKRGHIKYNTKLMRIDLLPDEEKILETIENRFEF